MVNAECLPTEIWLEIFSYLTAAHNIKAFSNLNRFFDRFASTKYFGIHYHLTNDKCKPNHSKSSTKGLQYETIRSLLACQESHRHLIPFLRLHADELIHLRQLTVHLQKNTTVQLVNDLIDVLKQFSLLTSLEIRWRLPNVDDWRMSHLLIVLFSEQLALTHCRLLFPLTYFHLPKAAWSEISSIRYLTFEKISWSNLLLILNQTPNLVALEVSIVHSRFELSTLVLPSLRKVQLTIDQMPFAVLAEIRRFAPHLNFFVVQGSFLINDPDYFREDLWRKLFDSISFYYIALATWLWREEERARLKEIYASLSQNQWLDLSSVFSWTHPQIIFQSK